LRISRSEREVAHSKIAMRVLGAGSDTTAQYHNHAMTCLPVY